MPELSTVDRVVHHTKVQVHRVVRWLEDRRDPIVPARSSRLLVDQPTIAEDRSPLWNHEAPPREWPLELGKVENLRGAARALDGLELEAGQTFSFWAQVGPPLAVRGFVVGRELREGCVVPGIGGGLCLLSNGLYAAARAAGLEIIERHPHSRRPPGSRAQLGEDATVAWNYVDLRLRGATPWRLEVRLSADELIVAIRSERRRHSVPVLHERRRHAHEQAGEAERGPRWGGDAGRSCLSCDRPCVQAVPPPRGRSVARGRRIWLVDAAWPEFARFMTAELRADDRVAMPLDGRRFHQARYAWPAAAGDRRIQFPLRTLARSLRSRRLASQGAARQRALLDEDRKLAEAMAGALEPADTELVVAHNLLPFLARVGALGGRRVTVLMQRLPLFELQARLDEAAARHPHSPTLADFRAQPRLLDEEAQALDDAVEIVTPHAEVARCFPGKARLVPWSLPTPVVVRARRRGEGEPLTLWLPSSTVGRKGVWELRAALELLARRQPHRPRPRLWILGRELEGDRFWQGSFVELRRGAPSLASLDAAVLPAWIEHQPRALLRAAAAGVPVIASRACGLSEVEGVREIEAGGVEALTQALADLDHQEESEALRSPESGRKKARPV